MTKVSPRPRFNANIDAELRRVRMLRATIERRTGPDRQAAELLPEVDGPFDQGPLRSSLESYAGRWTAADICFRTPDRQEPVLLAVIEAADRFCRATISQETAWSRSEFDQHLGTLFDSYRELVGPDPTLDRFRRQLLQRSDALEGRIIPFAQRHFDLGPWNVVVAESTGLSFIDWELGPPRAVDQTGPVGADQLYFIKYWLHIAMGLQSVDEELMGFVFLAPGRRPGQDHRDLARLVFEQSLRRVGLPTAFVPLLEAHLWLDAALHTIARRRSEGIEPGSPGRYLDQVARYGDRLLATWPLRPSGLVGS